MYRFYLNYVGCKVGESSLISNFLVSFTLTMWDVKNNHNHLVASMLMFYLNYVGCKVLYSLLKLVLCI